MPALKLTVLPERVQTSKQAATMGIKLAKPAGSWKVSDFILDIPGVPGIRDSVQSVAAIEIIEGIKRTFVGDSPASQNTPTGLRNNGLSLGITSAKAGALGDWANARVERKQLESKSALFGTLTYLSGGKPLFSLEFRDMELVSYKVGGATAGLALSYEEVAISA